MRAMDSQNIITEACLARRRVLEAGAQWNERNFYFAKKAVNVRDAQHSSANAEACRLRQR